MNQPLCGLDSEYICIHMGWGRYNLNVFISPSWIDATHRHDTDPILLLSFSSSLSNTWGYPETNRERYGEGEKKHPHFQNHPSRKLSPPTLTEAQARPYFDLTAISFCCFSAYMGIYRALLIMDFILRSYPREYTRSLQTSEVKHEWARLVLGLVTTWESLVP